MTLAFDLGVRIILGVEGLRNVDEGGDTVFGIARNFHRDEEPWPPSRERAIEIYRSEYWYKFGCDKLPGALGIALLDGVVNQGGFAVRSLQSAVGVVSDGIMGPNTILAAIDKPIKETLALYMATRALRYSLNPSGERLGLEARTYRVTWALSELVATGQLL